LGGSLKNNESPFGKDFGPAKGDFFCEKWLRKNLFISFAEKLQK